MTPPATRSLSTDRRHTLRYAAALVGVAGAVALAGCSAPAADADAPATSDTGTDTGTGTGTDSGSSTGGSSSGTYTDGTYEASGSYQTPESVETIDVTITLADGVITAVEVTGDPQRSESERYQSAFISGIEDVVVGESIDDISVSRVAGSSLTSGGFNQAIDEIKSEAQA